MTKTYIGDRPTLRIDAGVDLEDLSPTSQSLMVKKPDGTLVEWTTTVESPATGGFLIYTCGASDLDQVGAFLIQAKVQRASDAQALPLGATVALQVHQLYQ